MSLIIDEAWDMLKGGHGADIIESIAGVHVNITAIFGLALKELMTIMHLLQPELPGIIPTGKHYCPR